MVVTRAIHPRYLRNDQSSGVEAEQPKRNLRYLRTLHSVCPLRAWGILEVTFMRLRNSTGGLLSCFLALYHLHWNGVLLGLLSHEFGQRRPTVFLAHWSQWLVFSSSLPYARSIYPHPSPNSSLLELRLYCIYSHRECWFSSLLFQKPRHRLLSR